MATHDGLSRRWRDPASGGGQLQLLRKPAVLVILITILALAVRLPGLGTFMTIDEENWMLRSSVFWHELFRQGDPTGTFLTTHPGVITMWLAGAGITWQENRLGFDIDTSNIRAFRTAAILPITLTTALLIGLVTWAAIPLLGHSGALIGGFLLAVDPYLVGMSQIVHLDALLGLLMLNALLLFLRYCASARRLHIVICAVLTGAALMNKFLPALWLLVMYGVILLGYCLAARTVFWARLRHSVGTLAAIALLSALTIFILWPAIWSQPDVFRYVRQDTGQVVANQHVQLEESKDPITPASFYVRTVFARTTPLVLLVTIAGLLVILRALGHSQLRARLLSAGLPPVATNALLLAYATGYLVLITFVAKKGDRYALPALVVFPLVSGWALSIAWQQMQSKFPNLSSSQTTSTRSSHGLPSAALLLISALIIAQTLLLSPHAIAYSNSWLDWRSPTQQGWGEGLEQAAAWLNLHPLGDKLFVATWYPRVLGPYFQGTTLRLSSRHDDRIGFIVTYRNMAGREPDDISTNVLDELRGEKPVHTVFIGGIPYVWIYDTIGLHYFPQNTGELYGGGEVGQTVTPDQANWSGIHIGLATFSGRANTHDVVLHIRESHSSREDLRTVLVNARDITDSAYHHFTFAPLPDSVGKTYYIALTSPTSQPGDAVTVKFSPIDLLPGVMFLRRAALAPGENNDAYQRSGDIAYRID